MEQYLSMLKDSLLKKEKILIDLLSKSDEQGELVKKDDVDWERFGELVDVFYFVSSKDVIFFFYN